MQTETIESQLTSSHEAPTKIPPPVRVLLTNAWSSCHGGSSTSLLDIVTNMDRSRFEPLVLCREPGDLPDRLMEANIPVCIHANTRLSKETLLRFSIEVAWYYWFLRKKRIRLIHANVGGARASIAFAAKIRGIPYIQHVRNRMKSGQERVFGFRWAARIISNSNAAGEVARNNPQLSDKTVTVYNSVELSRYNSDENHRAEFDQRSSPIIGFVGHLVPDKGLVALIKAFPMVLAEFPSATLVLVGCAPDGYEEFEKEIHALARGLDVDSRIQWTGYRRDVPMWMRTFDVFVLPTHKETFGKVVVEAMAASCPVVASAVGGIPEIITDDSIGRLIPPNDPKATAEAILPLLRDKALAKRVGRAGELHAREHFSIARMMEHLQSVYTDVLNESDA